MARVFRYLPAAFSLFMALLLGFVLWTSKDWRITARLFPWVIAVPVFVLAWIQVVKDFRRIRGGGEVDADFVDLEVDDGVDLKEAMGRAGVLWAWVGGYFVAVLAFGFLVASPLYVLVYLVFRAKASWKTVAIAVAFVLMLQHGIFERVVHLPWLVPLIRGPQDFLLGL